MKLGGAAGTRGEVARGVPGAGACAQAATEGVRGAGGGSPWADAARRTTGPARGASARPQRRWGAPEDPRKSETPPSRWRACLRLRRAWPRGAKAARGGGGRGRRGVGTVLR